MAYDYDPSTVEPKWQKAWEEAKVYSIDLHKAKDPFYALVMFPYPSGARLHVGHWYQYGPTDSYARFLRMHGKDVFFPMGFDAFGLPAENYAIKTGVPPAQSTAENVATMIEQFKRMGTMYDWDKTVNTSESWYYRWTQWLFLQMFKHELAYRKEAPVNWCPKDQTVLANEQAQDGLCERCGTPVEQKLLTQWFWKITDYAQELLDGLNDLDWPEKTKTMQRNWIGRKEGIEISYHVDIADTSAPWEDHPDGLKVVVFTTRPETNFGATFVVVSPEHPDLMKMVTPECRKNVERYVAEARKKTTSERGNLDRTKTGAFTGHYAINDLTGYNMPIYVADYVLMSFGTGAVVGVPGHDMRDFEFAKAMGIEIKRVIKSSDGDTSPIDSAEQVFEDEGELINSEFLNGLHPHAAIPKMMDYMEKEGMGKRTITYRLHDWLVSRQRYWGGPIPIVYDPEGNPHPIPDKHLPWLLPTDVEFKPTGESPLRHSKELKERTEKIFGKGWTPEYDTMDTFVCSSFYFLIYLNAIEHHSRLMVSAEEGSLKKTKKKKSGAHDIADPIVDPSLEKKWMPVSLYIGGPEHACMHLIYARFVMMALNDFGFVAHSEPFQKLVHQGLVTNKGAKMSKSKGNVVSPDDYVARHGSDVFRMYLMFMGPYTDGGDWSDTGIKGITRFVQRTFLTLTTKVGKKSMKEDPVVLRSLHTAIKSVTESMNDLRFNTAISSLMELLNVLEKREFLAPETALTFARLLGPLAPHLAEELWEKLGQKGFIVHESWPTYDAALLVSDTMTIVIQVNGKVRGSIEVASDASKEEILTRAKTQENVQKFLGTGIKKEIYVPGKLVNFVV